MERPELDNLEIRKQKNIEQLESMFKMCDDTLDRNSDVVENNFSINDLIKEATSDNLI